MNTTLWIAALLCMFVAAPTIQRVLRRGWSWVKTVFTLTRAFLGYMIGRPPRRI